MKVSLIAIVSAIAASTLIGATSSQAQGYYRQEQDRAAAYQERRDLRQDYRERNRAANRFQYDRAAERYAENHGNYGAASYYARREDADARRLRLENRDIRQDRRELGRDRVRCYRDGTAC